MAAMFYTAAEAAQKLGTSEDELKTLVRQGKLREFRDAGEVKYKVGDVDKLAPDDPIGSAEPDDLSASGSADILLEPVEDSGIELAATDDDVISLEGSAMGTATGGTASGGTAAAKTSSGTTATGRKSKEDTVVPSVGVNVFDDDELDEHVDPLAQTAVTDLAGLGMEGAGSGSGILDLTRESDDTSLGRELLEEIYTGDEEGEEKVDVGEDTRAGLDGEGPEGDVPDTVDEVEGMEEEDEAAESGAKVVVREVVEYGPDPVSSGLTALMGVAVIVLWIGGLGAAALVQGVTPGLIQTLYSKLWMFAAGAVAVSIGAGAVAYLMAKRSA